MISPPIKPASRRRGRPPLGIARGPADVPASLSPSRSRTSLCPRPSCRSSRRPSQALLEALPPEGRSALELLAPLGPSSARPWPAPPCRCGPTS